MKIEINKRRLEPVSSRTAHVTLIRIHRAEAASCERAESNRAEGSRRVASSPAPPARGSYYEMRPRQCLEMLDQEPLVRLSSAAGFANSCARCLAAPFSRYTLYAGPTPDTMRVIYDSRETIVRSPCLSGAP